ncbi:MAG: hypothetical protein HRU36_05330 [Rickettsiales bacterium]|nr:hypothetical protein [Rickettsiales bacterium]
MGATYRDIAIGASIGVGVGALGSITFSIVRGYCMQTPISLDPYMGISMSVGMVLGGAIGAYHEELYGALEVWGSYYIYGAGDEI